VLLLVAIIAAIALTLRERKDRKHMNPSQQVRSSAADRVRIVKMAPRSRRRRAAAETATKGGS
jgi:NADH-quinone oxidoreductase subunit J